MKKAKDILIILMILVMAWINRCHAEQKTFTLVTYYPPPIGAYDKFRLIPRTQLADPCQTGSFYLSSNDKIIRFCYDDETGMGTGNWDRFTNDLVGDVDLDGAINLTDAYIIWGLGGGPVIDIRGNIIPPDTWRGDVNDDGFVDQQDVFLLRDYLQGQTAQCPRDRLGWFYINDLENLDNALTVEGEGIVMGEVSIGDVTSTSGNRVSVKGGVVVGSTYSTDKEVAPTNGLLVQGKLGIGTMSPSAVITVNGAISRHVPGGYNSNQIHGAAANTHINLSAEGQTGTPGKDYVHATTGGGFLNWAGHDYSTVSGGVSNRATGRYSTIIGGYNNTAQALGSSIAGGQRLSIDDDSEYSTIGGGYLNSIDGQSRYTTIVGGSDNSAKGSDYSTIAGGYKNFCKNANYAFISGELNQTDADYSWVGGRNMGVSNSADKTFLWGHDSSPINITASDSFIIYSGNVGIGTINPTHQLELSLNSAAKPGGGTWTAPSDIRFKKDVNPLKGALDKLLQLRGIKFRWKEPEKHGNLTGIQRGMIAQEVEKIFPEWVTIDKLGYKNVTFRGFEALTVGAIREMKGIIDTLKSENKLLREKIRILKKEKMKK